MKNSNLVSPRIKSPYKHCTRWISCFLLWSTLLYLPTDAEMVTYGIGNSLTLDMFFNYTGKGIDMLTAGTADPTRTGQHLRCSSSLTEIMANPNDTCAPTGGFGVYTTALSQGRIDNLVLQPHYGSSVANEIQSMKNLIDLAKQNPLNNNTRFYLYAPWGTQTDTGTGQSFYDTWNNFQATLPGGYAPSRSTFDLMMRELDMAGYDVTLIPVGHAWISTIDAIRGGTTIDLTTTTNGVPGTATLTESQLWRDPIHASSVGGFIAGLTAYSAFYGTEPVGLDSRFYRFDPPTPPAAPFPFDYYLTSGSARQIEQMTWRSYLSTIPEPSSFAITGCVLTSLVFSRRRQAS